MLMFFLGMLAGGFFGVAVMCILSVASDDDDSRGV